MSFEAYRERHRRAARRVWFAVVCACAAVGYAAGQSWSLLIGAVVTLVLLVAAEIVYRRIDAAIWLKRFPELDDPNVRWAWRGWFLQSREGVTFPNRSAKPS
jgi:hypothetical protein